MEPEFQRMEGCIYDLRNDYFRLDIESVERRLTIEYMEFLQDILATQEEIDKVFYIVAYHYLALCKQLGYQLTGASDAPFPFLWDEMSPRAKINYEAYRMIFENGFYKVVKRFDEHDLVFYNQCYCEFGAHHHACKHFSLLEELVGFDFVVNRYEFCYVFERALKLLIFQYRAIYTTEQLHVYMGREVKDMVREKCGLNKQKEN